MRVDNCLVEIDGPEPPGLDGSSHGFVQVLRQAGMVLQPARRSIWAVPAPITVRQQGATLTLHPATQTKNYCSAPRAGGERFERIKDEG